ncbi:MAG: radical SAM family heme chaperone HemW [Campylobacterota bacterium]|nr:radical SAM family heme chaperone HemW [Campylobacterota bacterium]
MLLYIHIPFCDSKCSYCAFNSYVDKFHLKKEYMEALYTQIEYELKHFKVVEKSIETVFIGGGTPSTIPPKLYEPIFTLLKPYLDDDIEITSEANPNSATYEWLEGVYRLGVNRISFGVQSFDKEKLKILNRSHSASQAIESVKNAKKIGFENLSLDLIYATFGDTKELLKNDIDKAFALPINHISAYALTIEENTLFEKKPQISSEKIELTDWLFKKIEEKGFKQYEISNFGSYQSFHNLGYWLYKDYIGAGCGAVGKLESKRFYPKTSVEKYIENPLDIRVEELSDEDIKIEKIFLGFRSDVGVSSELLNQDEVKLANILVKEKKLVKKDNAFYNLNYLLTDEIVLFITRD